MITEYGKILTLFERDEKTFKVIESAFKSPAFKLIPHWHIEEKIHGQNVRIHWNGGDAVFFFGRTADSSSLHKDLLKHLEAKYTVEAFRRQFKEGPVILFGEGCGAGIQKGGGSYSQEKTFVLFDVLVADKWWLEPQAVSEVAEAFDAHRAPILAAAATTEYIVELVKSGLKSTLAKAVTGADHDAEGIIAKTVPGLFMRDGSRLMFKLKTHDFAKPAAVGANT